MSAIFKMSAFQDFSSGICPTRIITHFMKSDLLELLTVIINNTKKTPAPAGKYKMLRCSRRRLLFS